MGLDVDADHFTDDDFARFAARLAESLEALEALLARPGFGAGAPSLGGELEVSLVGIDGRPLGVNWAVLADTVGPDLQVEVDRFNLECNTAPVPLAGRPFSALGAELDSALAALAEAAAGHGARVAAIGILPTLSTDDLDGALTQTSRYRALSHGIRRLRQRPFEIRIEGDDTLALTCEDVTYEGATTAWQVHLKVTPEAFARTYNAAQIAIAPVLAAAGNSPTFLGHRLWEETRVALFRQSVDERPGADQDDWRPARVTFGHGWVRGGALELFAESVALHPPLLASVATESPLAVVRAGGVPELRELRLHQSTVWRWNRAVYDPAEGGHLRVEMRALPAGPTVVDMLANTAFLIGLTLALAPRIDRIVSGFTFGHARRNFYAAARRGLEAELLWPADGPPSPVPQRAPALIERLLPLAHGGLTGAGVAAGEADRLLEVIAARTRSRQTGAHWQRAALAGARPTHNALAAMLERYLALAAAGEPVHTWPARG